MADICPTVVVIDDNKTVLSQFQRGVDKLDMELKLICFDETAAAMDYLKDNKPKVIFLDILMPDMNGITFLTTLRKMPMHQSTFVIMITSKDYAQDRQLARELGALDFLTKPIPTQVITDLILTYIDKDNPY